MTDKYHSDVVEGLEPSIQYARDLLSLSSFTAYSALTFAAKKDVDRKKYQLIISQNIHVENEAKRLMINGRSSEDLEAIYRNIEVSVDRELNIFKKKVSDELSALEKDLDEQLHEKLSVQREFENSVSELNLQLQDDLGELCEEDSDTYLRTKTALVLKFQNDCCEACKVAISKASALNAVFDELHIQRQYEQQKFEAMQYIIERTLESNFSGLVRTQQSRRNLGAALINEYEKDLKGLENILAEKKHRQQAFLKERLMKRKELRRQELLQDKRIAFDEISEIVEQEYENDLSAGEADILSRIEEELHDNLSRLETNTQRGLKDLSTIERMIDIDALESSFGNLIGKVMMELSSDLDQYYEITAQNTGSTDESAASVKMAYLSEKKTMLEELERSTNEHLRLQLENDANRLELAHMAALEALNAELDSKKKQSMDVLKARLHSMRPGRISEMIATGASEAEAEARVEVEYNAALNNALKGIEQDESSAKAELQAKYSKLMDDLNREYQKSFDILQNGLEKHLNNSDASIQSSLAMEKRQDITTLIENGMDISEAETAAEVKFNNALQSKRKENATLARIAAEKVRDVLAENIDAKARNIRAEHDRKLLGLAVAQAHEKEAALKSLRNRLEKRRAQRTEALVALGIDKEQAIEIAAAECGDIDGHVKEYEEHLDSRHLEEFKTRADALSR